VTKVIATRYKRAGTTRGGVGVHPHRAEHAHIYILAALTAAVAEIFFTRSRPSRRTTKPDIRKGIRIKAS